MEYSSRITGNVECGRELSLHQRNIRRYKRKKLRRKRVTIMMVLLIVVFILGMFLGSSIVTIKASARETEVTRERFLTSICIEPGDTLWSIAQTYITDDYDGIKAYVKEVKEINQLKSNKLIAGAYLCVPYYKEVVTSNLGM